MARLLSFIPLLLLVVCSYSQELSHITLSGGTTLSSISFRTDQKVIIQISENGKIIDWGTEYEPRAAIYYPGKLRPYMGRVEYYTQAYDSVVKGKVKSIGTCTITYYGSSETDAKIGKIKSIGGVELDYYTSYDNPDGKGKIKSAGTHSFNYYTSFDNVAFKNKLKSVDNTSLNYYSSFDDKLIQGKIKSIGTFNYTWYTSRDRREYQGAMKSGSVTQNTGGVTYIVR